ncbi:kinase-like protein [Obba rivulosa]|uniref:non-specific serine/threonine protein kinase n=1 Tax=Obba rivulosa TaxID=1052685 RepID=A0A8E2DIW3_9APHY|nr:kinase-like protein [Obba rivulosa]
MIPFLSALFARRTHSVSENGSFGVDASYTPVADKLRMLGHLYDYTSKVLIRSILRHPILSHASDGITQLPIAQDLQQHVQEDSIRGTLGRSAINVVISVGIHTGGRHLPPPRDVLSTLLFWPDFRLFPALQHGVDASGREDDVPQRDFPSLSSHSSSTLSVESNVSSGPSVSSSSTCSTPLAGLASSDDAKPVKVPVDAPRHSSGADTADADVDALDAEEQPLPNPETEHDLFPNDTAVPDEPIVLHSPFGDAYLVQCLLGSGAQGRVLLVEEECSGERFALKVVPKQLQYVKRSGRTYALVEKECMQRAMRWDLPFVMHLIRSWDDEENIYFVMPFCPETLFDRLQRGPMSPWHMKLIAAELVLALKDLHDRHIIHRDIKPENIFLTFNGHVLLGDFGLAWPYTAPGVTDLYEYAIPGDVVGTVGYLAPELIDPENIDRRYTAKIDMYSLGLVFDQLFSGSGQRRYNAHRASEQWEMMETDTADWADCIENEKAQDLVFQMLYPVPDLRPTVEELLDHPYFTGRDDSTDGINWAHVAAQQYSGVRMSRFKGPPQVEDLVFAGEGAGTDVAAAIKSENIQLQLEEDAARGVGSLESDFAYRCPRDQEIDPRHGPFTSDWEAAFTWNDGQPVPMSEVMF